MAGRLAPGLLVVSCLVIGVLLLLRDALARAPVFFPILFWLIALLLIACAVLQWRERLRAGGATLILPQDPLPLGVPWKIAVEFARQPAVGNWRARMQVRRQLPHEEDSRTVWHTELAISQPTGSRAMFTLRLPPDLPNTVDRTTKESISCELHIVGPHGAWSFDLATRPANELELATLSVGSNRRRAADADP
jgi:hypothetical protein